MLQLQGLIQHPAPLQQLLHMGVTQNRVACPLPPPLFTPHLLRYSHRSTGLVLSVIELCCSTHNSAKLRGRWGAAVLWWHARESKKMGRGTTGGEGGGVAESPSCTTTTTARGGRVREQPDKTFGNQRPKIMPPNACSQNKHRQDDDFFRYIVVAIAVLVAYRTKSCIIEGVPNAPG